MISSSSILALVLLPRIIPCAFAIINKYPSNHVAAHLRSVPVRVVSVSSVLTDGCDPGPKLLGYLATTASISTFYILTEGAFISARLRTNTHIFLDRPQPAQLAASFMTWTIWCA